MLERILVGFDGSHQSKRACEFASELAGRFHSALTLVVVRPEQETAIDPTLENLVPQAEDGRAFGGLLEEIGERARARGARAVEVVYLTGETLEQLLGWLHHHPQDLVVVGSRGLSRGRRLLLGSVSTGLVNSAPCPVLVVRGAHGTRPSPRPATAGTEHGGGEGGIP